MSLALLLPAGLAALAALLLPLLIHLARRSEQRPIPFAALRWLRQKPKPRHRIRFDEWLLLAVRLLLLVAAGAAARAAGAVRRRQQGAVGGGGARRRPGSRHARCRQRRTQRWHWLAPGFPALDAPAPAHDRIGDQPAARARCEPARGAWR